METIWAQKSTKTIKTAELLFAHIKQNVKLNEFTTIGIKNTNKEFKLYIIEHNLKRIYKEIKTKITKNKKKQKNLETHKFLKILLQILFFIKKSISLFFQ